MSSPFSETPLGRKTDYVDTYTPSLLCPVPRWDAREELDIDASQLPFHGVDAWNAYEISWLDTNGKPEVAIGEFVVPCSSRNLIESKSLKLYLNGFANTRFENRQAVIRAMEKDLGDCAAGPVEVRLHSLEEAGRQPLWEFNGTCVDRLDAVIEQYDYDPGFLMADQGAERTETLYSHLVRSLCPVTNQPDWASVVIRYTGAPIVPVSVLRYLVSFRNHPGFHEQVIEQIFMDIMNQCRPRQLSVYGRFTRRGGLDINPFRSNYEDALPNRRTARQ
jgi:7-cyano-7-deazaguanine reductase